MRSADTANRPATEMDYRHRINQAMIYIRDNAEQKLSIRDIAEQAHFSSFLIYP
jgi:AraC-like DNA-binding protein